MKARGMMIEFIDPLLKIYRKRNITKVITKEENTANILTEIFSIRFLRLEILLTNLKFI